MLTSLRGADGQVYAVAQGPVVTGGFSAGRGGASQTVNHPTVGRAPNGAIVERAAPSVAPQGVGAAATPAIGLHDVGANRRGVIRSASRARPKPRAPAPFRSPFRRNTAPRSTEFIAELESLTVEADRPARVVVNERTGTIVLGKDVRIAAGRDPARQP